MEALLGLSLPAEIQQSLPADSANPFDNSYEDQNPSDTLVEAVRSVAEQASKLALSDPAGRARLVPCMPKGAGDTACFRQFLETFGRRALRRPLTAEELDDYLRLGAHATRANDFHVAVRLAIEAFLQDMHLLYRIELGRPAPGRPDLLVLDGYEIASRVSFLLWGTGPDDDLLDAAAAGRLATSDGIRALATSRSKDLRAKKRMNRFFAQWLGYEVLPYEPTLAAAMRRESDALVERTIWSRSWLDLFTATETYLDDALARHYGLAKMPGAAGWVSYGPNGRRGILSHGGFLAGGVKNGDTSLSRRGLNVRKRLLCQEVNPPPPELEVDVDEPPSLDPRACKQEGYVVHNEKPACAACHRLMDPIGLGLENYDSLGRYRAHDDGKPGCLISGEGELLGIGKFRGPAGLADVLIASKRLDECGVAQLFRFAVGRTERDGDAHLIGALLERFRRSKHRFDELLIEIVALPGFRYRLVDPSL